MKILRLVLGDQLNPQHSWWSKVDNEITYLMVELRQESTYTVHHIQKLCGFFLSMRNFANHLKQAGHRVEYIKITDKDAVLSFEELILKYFKNNAFDIFEYQEPDEYRLAQELRRIHHIGQVIVYPTEHFLTDKNQLSEIFGGKPLLMETFYRQLRQTKGYLMNNAKPEGGKWNYIVPRYC